MKQENIKPPINGGATGLSSFGISSWFRYLQCKEWSPLESLPFEMIFENEESLTWGNCVGP